MTMKFTVKLIRDDLDKEVQAEIDANEEATNLMGEFLPEGISIIRHLHPDEPEVVYLETSDYFMYQKLRAFGDFINCLTLWEVRYKEEEV